MKRRRSGLSSKNVIIPLSLFAVVFVGLAVFRAGPSPSVAISSDLPGIGKKTSISVAVEEPKRGLSRVRVEFVQGERVELLGERTYTPRPPYMFWGERTARDEMSVDVGTTTLADLQEGPSVIRVTADRAGTLLRSPDPVVHELPLEVKIRPPAVAVHSTRTYVTQGGCEAVVYTVGESAVKDGVQAGEWWFPGYALPGGEPGKRFALFSAPYDLDDPERVRLVVADDVGNEATQAFVDSYKSRPIKTDEIRISDRFMSRVVPAILAQTTEVRDQGNLLDSYLEINGKLRSLNAQTLIDLNAKSAPEFLWTRRFLQMRNAKVMSDFADRRTYTYEGRAVDQQDHLGFDLASTRNAEVQAANDGVVLLARYFGIYGNAVVIDHGFGLMSLYGHLSSIAVGEGQQVVRGDAVGNSGETGLAGGDHLHFTMLLQGLAVDPREWWDGHWIHDRLVLKLGSALPFEE